MSPPMTSPWTISAAAERIALDAQRRGEITFTVTNTGPVDQRLVVDAVPGDRADQSWFFVTEPQRLIPHGGSATFLVKLAAAPGAPPGSYWLACRAYSADSAPEETSVLSDRVTFDLGGGPPPKPSPLLWLIPILVLLLIVGGVVAFLLLRGGDDEPPEPPTATATTTATTGVPQVHANGELDIQQTFSADLDELTIGGDQQVDIFFRARTATERFIEPLNGATVAKVGQTGDPVPACLTTAKTTTPVPIAGLVAGDVVCVQTDQGRLSVVTVLEPVGPSPGVLRIAVTTFQT